MSEDIKVPERLKSKSRDPKDFKFLILLRVFLNVSISPLWLV